VASVFSRIAPRQLQDRKSAGKGVATLNASLALTGQIELTIVSSYLDMPSDVGTTMCPTTRSWALSSLFVAGIFGVRTPASRTSLTNKLSLSRKRGKVRA
jgi:hypothetical protein